MEYQDSVGDDSPLMLTEPGIDYIRVASWVSTTGRISAVPANFSDAQAAASALSRHGHNKARAKIRAKCDEMNAALGRPAIVWS